MQLFLVEREPDLIARALDDRRLNKQALEGVQLMSNVVIGMGESILKANGEPMKPWNPNHPLCRWTAYSGQAFRLVYDVSVECLIEHHHRFGSSSDLMVQLRQLKEYRYRVPDIPDFFYCLCLPDEYLEAVGARGLSDLDKVVKLYRHYCWHIKRMQLDNYSKRVLPQWLIFYDKIGDVRCSELTPF